MMGISSHPAFMPTGAAAHHSLVSRVECDALANELRTDLMSIASKDQRVIQLRKDLSQFKNKAPETLAAILADAHNRQQPVADRIASTIVGFFSSRRRQLLRQLSEIMQIETVEEGQLNNIQMRVAQGDDSMPALLELRKEVRENKAILDELEMAIEVELSRRARERAERSGGA